MCSTEKFFSWVVGFQELIRFLLKSLQKLGLLCWLHWRSSQRSLVSMGDLRYLSLVMGLVSSHLCYSALTSFWALQIFYTSWIGHLLLGTCTLRLCIVPWILHFHFIRRLSWNKGMLPCSRITHQIIEVRTTRWTLPSKSLFSHSCTSMVVLIRRMLYLRLLIVVLGVPSSKLTKTLSITKSAIVSTPKSVLLLFRPLMVWNWTLASIAWIWATGYPSHWGLSLRKNWGCHFARNIRDLVVMPGGLLWSIWGDWTTSLRTRRWRS